MTDGKHCISDDLEYKFDNQLYFKDFENKWTVSINSLEENTQAEWKLISEDENEDWKLKGNDSQSQYSEKELKKMLDLIQRDAEKIWNDYGEIDLGNVEDILIKRSGFKFVW